jgi:thiamine kinase-like enzyme
MHNARDSVQLKNSEPLIQLEQLSCFKGISKIEPIEQGLSHKCFKVTTVDGLFFAKFFKNKSSKINQSLALQKEFVLTSLAFTHQLTAEVVFHDQQWLISRFILAPTLSNTALTANEKIDHCLTVMAQCHQLPINENLKELVKVLKLDELIEQLKGDCLLSQSQDKYLTQLIDPLIKKCINADVEQSVLKSKKVLCHGDINYSNVIVGEKNWLIDFECAYIAAPEFDLAMMIAVNEITLAPFKKSLKNLCQQYALKHLKKPFIDDDLVTRYLLLCFIINGLWYFSQAKQQEGKNYRELSEKQFIYFDKLCHGTTSLAKQMR